MTKPPRIRVVSVYRPIPPVKTLPPKQLAKRLEELYCQPDSPDFARGIRLKRCIGIGGMNVVFLGEKINPGKHSEFFAVKIASGEMRQALRREIQESLSHNIEACLEDHQIPSRELLQSFGHFIQWKGEETGPVIEESPTYVAFFEYISGETIAQRMEHRPIPVFWALNTIRQISDALAISGKVHKDINRRNIMLIEYFPILIDFGCARAVNAMTLAYASPEQLKGEIILDQKTDVYSLGCVLWEMLSGQRVFSCVAAETRANLLAAKQVPLPPIPDLPCPDINLLIEWMTQPKAVNRPTHAEVVENIVRICKDYGLNPFL